jgi:hypothetical protein
VMILPEASKHHSSDAPLTMTRADDELSNPTDLP